MATIPLPIRPPVGLDSWNLRPAHLARLAHLLGADSATVESGLYVTTLARGEASHVRTDRAFALLASDAASLAGRIGFKFASAMPPGGVR